MLQLLCFKRLQKILGKIPNINAGGCGVSAYAMYLYLKKHGCLNDFQVILLDEYFTKDEHKQNLAFVEGKSSKSNGAAHIAVTFDGGKTIQDAKGVVDDTFEYTLLVPSHKTEAYFNALFTAKVRWNSAFNMHESIPVIEKKLGIKLGINLDII